jgi:hypothetical protein
LFSPAIKSPAISPNFFSARSKRSFQGTAQLSRMKLPYFFWLAENSGLGAIMQILFLNHEDHEMHEVFMHFMVIA